MPLNNLPQVIGSEVTEPLQVKFLESLERSGNDAIELQTGQTQVGAYLGFVFFGDVIAKKRFAVSFHFQFPDHLAHDLSPFFAQELFKRIRLRIANLLCLPKLFLTRRPPHPPDVIEGSVAGNAANKPGESFRLAHIAISDLLQRDSERVLGKIFFDRLVMNDPLDDDGDAIFVVAHQFRFGVRIAGNDSPHPLKPICFVAHPNHLHILSGW
jgi:hypothetical protein